MDDRRELIRGDPPDRGERPAHPPGSLFHDPARPAPERPVAPPAPDGDLPQHPGHGAGAPGHPGAYAGGPVPPGAFAPRRERPPPPSPDELATFGRRALAFVLDMVILGAAAVVVLVVLAAVAGGGSAVVDDGSVSFRLVAGGLAAVALFWLLALLYAPVVMARTDGQTVGKLIAGCRVVRTDGRPVTFWWAAYRELAIKGALLGIAAALTGGIAYLVNFMWPVWDGRRRALHDFVADSRVVRAGPPGGVGRRA